MSATSTELKVHLGKEISEEELERDVEQHIDGGRNIYRSMLYKGYKFDEDKRSFKK